MSGFAFFGPDGRYSSEVLDLLSDLEDGHEGRLSDDLTAKGLSVLSADVAQFIRSVETEVQQCIWRIAHLVYAMMDQSGNWRDLGDSAVKSSFCRVLLQIDSESDISPDQWVEFDTQVGANLQSLGFDALTDDGLQSAFKAFRFELLGQSFKPQETSMISTILRYIGSDLVLQGGYYGEDLEYILGTGDRITEGEFSVVTIEHEHIRTPNNIMAMAAVIGEKNIFVRMESLKSIFVMKWLPTFDPHSFSAQDLAPFPEHDIAEGLKRRTLYLYNARDRDSISLIKSAFLSDLKETVLHHEIGHGIIQHHILPVEEATLAEVSRLYGENIITSFLELFADIAPLHAEARGPLQNMVELGRTNPEQATRMFMMCFCDVWFYNTQDVHMLMYSDLICLFMVRFLQDDGSVDFDRLETDLIHSEDGSSLFDQIVAMFVAGVRDLRQHIETRQFSLQERSVEFDEMRFHVMKTSLKESFEQLIDNTHYSPTIAKHNFMELHDHLISKFTKSHDRGHDFSYELRVHFWTEICKVTLNDPELKASIDRLIYEMEGRLMSQYFQLIVGHDIADQYDQNHRQYIFDRLSKSGLTASRQS